MKKTWTQILSRILEDEEGKVKNSKSSQSGNKDKMNKEFMEIMSREVRK